MKHIQVIDRETSASLGVFSATEEEFRLLFPAGQAAIVLQDSNDEGHAAAKSAIQKVLQRPISKREVPAIHGVVFFSPAYESLRDVN